MAIALIALMYEVGTARWFGFPVSMIHLTWERTALAFAAVAGILHIFLMMGYVLSGWQGKWGVITPKRVMMWFPFLGGSVILLLQHSFQSQVVVGCAVVVGGVGAIDGAIGWVDRAAARRGVQLVDEDSYPLRSPFNRLALSMIWLLATLAIAFSTGYTTSQATMRFLVTDENIPRVLLKSYGSTLVLAPMDQGRSEFGPEMQFVPAGADTELSYVWRSLGRLTRAAEETQK